MDFELSDKAKAVEEQVSRFMDQYIYPAEREYAEQAEENPKQEPAIMLDLRAKAKAIGRARTPARAPSRFQPDTCGAGVCPPTPRRVPT